LFRIEDVCHAASSGTRLRLPRFRAAAKIRPQLRDPIAAADFFAWSVPDQSAARFRRSSGIVSPGLRSSREATLMETVRCGSATSISKLEHPAGQG
jgi:hypothetical protein